MSLAYAGLFIALGVWRYDVHRNLVDFGIFAQTSASAFGCFCNAIEGNHYAFHFSPILYAVGAALAVVRSPYTLIALQAIGGALVIPPIAGLVARRSDLATARWVALVVALYPALAGLIFNDFHENGFAPAAVAWMLYAFDGGYLAATLAAAVVAVAIKEDQAIFVAVAGALGAWRFKGTSAGRVALLIAIGSAQVAAYFFTHIQPGAAANPLWAPTRFYAWTAADIRPFLEQGVLARLGFVVLAFVPLLFLPFRSRMMWLAVAPLAEVLLSRMSTTYTLGTHYAGAWLGYVLVAFAFTIRREEPRRARALLVWCVALCALEFIVANPLHPGLNLRPIQTRDGTLDRELTTLPADISIATQEEAFTHLALGDPYARLLPDDPGRMLYACFILLDRDFPNSPRLQEYGGTIDALVQRRIYLPVYRSAGIELYRRVARCR